MKKGLSLLRCALVYGKVHYSQLISGQFGNGTGLFTLLCQVRQFYLEVVGTSLVDRFEQEQIQTFHQGNLLQVDLRVVGDLLLCVNLFPILPGL